MGSEWILGRLAWGVWIGFDCLRTGTDGGLLWVRWWTFGFLRHGVNYLSPVKIHCLRPGLNRQTLGPTESTIPLDHRGRAVNILIETNPQIFRAVPWVHAPADNTQFRHPITCFAVLGDSRQCSEIALRITLIKSNCQTYDSGQSLTDVLITFVVFLSHYCLNHWN
jgi:hypothetical protein